MKFRLPTEAEWEYAARGGKQSKGYTYSGSHTVGDVAWYTSNSDSKTHAVGQKVANELKIHDMSGNVWEWTSDWYQPYPGSTYEVDIYGEKQKVFRGGGWGGIGHYSLPLFYRAAYRSSIVPEEAYADLGFRCAKSP